MKRRSFLAGLAGLVGGSIGVALMSDGNAARRPTPAPKKRGQPTPTPRTCPGTKAACGPTCCDFAYQCCDNACCDAGFYCAAEETCLPL